jgi:Fe-S-cluster containining protein
MADDHPSDPRARTPEDPGDGLRFSHVVEMQTKQKLAELSASFYALIETMIAQGTLPLDDYERRRQGTMKREVERARDEASVTLNDTADKYALSSLPQIDCEARLHLCRARCCTLVFPLSIQDLDERVVRWDYGRPYQIGRRPDGYCVHNKPGTCTCTVYEKRPAVCRTYDCRKDTRIWVDFEKRIPAT